MKPWPKHLDFVSAMPEEPSCLQFLTALNPRHTVPTPLCAYRGNIMCIFPNLLTHLSVSITKEALCISTTSVAARVPRFLGLQ